MKKRRNLLILLFCVICNVVITTNVYSYNTGNDYPSNYQGHTYYSGYYGNYKEGVTPYGTGIVDSWNFYTRECTSFVAWCLNSRNGIKFTNQYGGVSRWSHGKNWGSVAKSLGIKVDNLPAVGAVAWWDTGTYGHVAWVKSVSGNDVTIEEYNNPNGSGNYNTRTISKSSVSGFIHIKDISGSSSTPVDLGTDFYATINHIKNNCSVSIDSIGWLQLAENGINDKTRWHFVKQSDGSYIIYLGVSSQCMDLANGNTTKQTKVGLSNVNYGNTQKWYIYKEEGYYVLKNVAAGLAMDVCYPYGSVGDNIQIWTPNQTQAQHFTINKLTPFNDWIYIHNESKTPVLYSDEDVIFNYDAVSSYYYDLWIYKDGVRQGQIYAGPNKTYQKRFEAGNYEILFASQNEVGWNYGNFHPFTVVDRYRTISFDANGGTTSQNAKYLQYNAAYGELLPASREGYRFKGWYTLPSGGEKITSESLATSITSITLYAQWESDIPHTLSTVTKSNTTHTVATEVYAIESGKTVLAVGYKNGKMIDFDKKEYAGVNLNFSLTGNLDEIRVMAWDSISSATPLCNAEVISQSEWVN